MFQWTLPLGAHPWVRQTWDNDHWVLEMDDDATKGNFTYDDIKLALYTEGERPTRVVKLHVGSSGSHDRLICKLRAGDEVLTEDWVALGDNTEIEAPAIYCSADYALSKGTYHVAGDFPPMVDSRMFLILDYNWVIADYDGEGKDDPWDKYFILDTDEWTAKYAEPDLTWHQYQALRHLGRANVLFCDGRVDSLGPEDLAETNPLWRYVGR